MRAPKWIRWIWSREPKHVEPDRELKEAQLRMDALENYLALVEFRRKGSKWKPHSSR